MANREASAQFQLLTTGDVLVTVTTTTGEAGVNDQTTISRCRMNFNDFFTQAFPILHQNYNSTPPWADDPQPPPAEPPAELPPPPAYPQHPEGFDIPPDTPVKGLF